VLEDYEAGFEYAEAAALLGMRRAGDSLERREYLVQWADAQRYPDSWEDEDSLPAQLIAAWHAEHPEEESDVRDEAPTALAAV